MLGIRANGQRLLMRRGHMVNPGMTRRTSPKSIHAAAISSPEAPPTTANYLDEEIGSASAGQEGCLGWVPERCRQSLTNSPGHVGDPHRACGSTSPPRRLGARKHVDRGGRWAKLLSLPLPRGMYE